ncbi:MAG: AzlC family ABC transporter permease [Pseudomonadota bacterium]
MLQRQDTDWAAPSARGVRAGATAALQVVVAVIPFGMIFGVVATEAGLNLWQTMAMTVIVIAGASQFVALEFLTDGAPAAIAVLAGSIVNLRMAMYSATLATYWTGVPMRWRLPAAFVLHDQSFALSIARQRAFPAESVSDRLGYFLGVGVLTSSVWVVATYAGASLGSQIPAEWGVEFAVPVTFLAIAVPLIRTRADWAAALVAGALAILLSDMPYGTGLLIAAAAGIAAGMAAKRAGRAT